MYNKFTTYNSLFDIYNSIEVYFKMIIILFMKMSFYKFNFTNILSIKVSIIEIKF